MESYARASAVKTRVRWGVLLLLSLSVCASLVAPLPAVAAYRQTYGFVQKWAFPSPPLGFSPLEISAAPNGNLLVAANGSTVSEYTTTGVPVATLGAGAGIAQIISVAARGTDMWVLSPDNEVKKLDLAGNYAGVTLSGSPRPFSMTSAVAVDASGCVYVADKGGVTGYNVQVTKFSSSGAYIATFGTHGSATDNTDWLWSASSIAIGPNWDVYVADWQGGTVRRYTPNATRTSYSPTARWKSAEFDSPTAVAVSTEGSVFVLDSSTLTVTKLSSAGTAFARWGGSGTTSGKFTTPRGLAVTTNGRVFVSDRDGLDVQEFELLDLGPSTYAKANVSVKRNKTAKFKYKVVEDVGSTATVTIKIYKGSKRKATIKCGTVGQGVWRTKSWKAKLAKGKYKWKVYAVDATGHAQRNVATRTLTVK